MHIEIIKLVLLKIKWLLPHIKFHKFKLNITSFGLSPNGVKSIGYSVSFKFTFTSTEDDVPTGNGTCQISVNGSVKTTFSIEQGLTVLDIKDYLILSQNKEYYT